MIKINPDHIVSVEIFPEVEICKNYEIAIDRFFVMAYSAEKGEYRRYIDEEPNHFRNNETLWQKPFVFIKTIRDNRQLSFNTVKDASDYIEIVFPNFITVD